MPDDALIMHEETFGPVAAVNAFDTEDEVIARANATEYGLVAYVVTENRAASGAGPRAGIRHGRDQPGEDHRRADPLRRLKQSGIGREGSRHGLEAFTELKYLCLDWA